MHSNYGAFRHTEIYGKKKLGTLAKLDNTLMNNLRGDNCQLPLSYLIGPRKS